MKLLFLILTSTLAFKPNLCIQCKFYKKDRFSDPKFGKCTLFPILVEDDHYEVTGIVTQQTIEHKFCSIVRRHGECGLEGRLFKPKD